MLPGSVRRQSQVEGKEILPAQNQFYGDRFRILTDYFVPV